MEPMIESSALVIEQWSIEMKIGPKTFGLAVPTLTFIKEEREYSHAIAKFDLGTMRVMSKQGLVFKLGQSGDLSGLLDYSLRKELGLVPNDEYAQRYFKARYEYMDFLIKQNTTREDIISLMRLTELDTLGEMQSMADKLKQRLARKRA